MNKFIKFIANNGLAITNIDEIVWLHFSKEKQLIMMKLKNESIKQEFEYNSLEDFKQQCDAIMEQLEI